MFDVIKNTRKEIATESFVPDSSQFELWTRDSSQIAGPTFESFTAFTIRESDDAVRVYKIYFACDRAIIK